MLCQKIILNREFTWAMKKSKNLNFGSLDLFLLDSEVLASGKSSRTFDIYHTKSKQIFQKGTPLCATRVTCLDINFFYLSTDFQDACCTFYNKMRSIYWQENTFHSTKQIKTLPENSFSEVGLNTIILKVSGSPGLDPDQTAHDQGLH